MSNWIRAISALNPWTPFYIFDVKQAKRIAQHFKTMFPTVQPYYAMKCNTHSHLLTTLHQEGYGFDCASIEEVKTVSRLFYRDPTPPKVIFANPVKIPDHIVGCRDYGYHMYTADSLSEIDKIITIDPDAQILLRIKVDDRHSRCPMSKKFGYPTDTLALESLRDNLTDRHHPHLSGLAFHVGSACQSPDSYRQALIGCQRVRDHIPQIGHTIDIGGGFLPRCDQTFGKIGQIVDEFTRRWPDYRLISEPGRFLATRPFSLYVKIVGLNGTRIHINSSIYGDFNCKLYDGYHPTPDYVHLDDGTDLEVETQSQYDIYGITCDGADVICEGATLPKHLRVGDLLVFKDMGAYTMAGGSTFNGFPKAIVHHTSENFLS